MGKHLIIHPFDPKQEEKYVPAPVPPVFEILGSLSHETSEYECGSYCSPHGCGGHDSGVPCYLYIADEQFVVAGYDAGDFPNETAERVIDVVAKAEQAAGLFKPAMELLHEMLVDQEMLKPELRNQALRERAWKTLHEAEYPGYESPTPNP